MPAPMEQAADQPLQMALQPFRPYGLILCRYLLLQLIHIVLPPEELFACMQ